MILSNPREISSVPFPKKGSIKEKIIFLLHYAILAPSNMNSQPWKFEISKNTVYFYPDESSWLKVSDPQKRELFMSLGCALENFLIAAENFGFLTTVDYLTNNVKVTLKDTKIVTPSPLFQYIIKRFTYRGTFKNKKPQLDFFKNLENDFFSLQFITEKEEIYEIRRLSIEADIFKFIHPEYKDELLKKFPIERFEKKLTDFIYDLSCAIYEKKESKVVLKNTPVFGFLRAKIDDPPTWIKIGQFFETLYLKASSKQMSILPYSNLLEVPITREKFYQFFNCKKEKVIQTFCLGYPKEDKSDHHYSSRISLNKKLM